MDTPTNAYERLRDSRGAMERLGECAEFLPVDVGGRRVGAACGCV
jgi:hypothetical protein